MYRYVTNETEDIATTFRYRYVQRTEQAPAVLLLLSEQRSAALLLCTVRCLESGSTLACKTMFATSVLESVMVLNVAVIDCCCSGRYCVAVL